MSDILDKIVAVKRQEVAAAQKKSPIAAVRFDAESRGSRATSSARCGPRLPVARRP